MSEPIICPHCDSTEVQPTEPGCLASMLFLVMMLFVMSPLQKGDLYRCTTCGKTFRTE